jgi:hypothetical protein
MVNLANPKHDWSWFRNEMRACSDALEPACRPFLELIHECNQIVCMLLDRELAHASVRPQDFVVAILSVRAFRLTISSLYLALSGYPDSSPTLDRSVFEIAMRLLDLTTAPEAASLGYLIQGATEEISTMKAEIEHRNREGAPFGNLQENLHSMQEHVQLLEGLCRAKGIDPERARKRHGNLNFRQTARDFGIEKAYLVDYAYASSHVHEKNVATSIFYSETPEGRDFSLGPARDKAVHAVPDSVKYLTTVLEVASNILDDSELAHRSESLSASFDDRLSGLR